MDIWNVDKITLVVVFFLPGFISMKVYDLMAPGERRDFSKSLFEAISYSTLNFATSTAATSFSIPCRLP
jgi:hypothetical protein